MNVDWFVGLIFKWIWGVDVGKVYEFIILFDGLIIKVMLIVFCDNVMMIWFNDKCIFCDISWENVLVVDFFENFVEGDNNFCVCVENEGSVGGFVCKIWVWFVDGMMWDIVSDESWKVCEFEGEELFFVEIVGMFGDVFWWNVFGN